MPKPIKRVNFTITGGDSLTLNDSINVVRVDLQRKLSVSDALSYLDNIQLIEGTSVQLTLSDDFLPLDDHTTSVIAGIPSTDVEDSLIVTDSVFFLVSLFLVLTDQISLTDFVDLLQSNSNSLSDSYSLTDNIVLQLANVIADQTISDTLSFNDSVQISVEVSKLDPYLRRYLNDVPNA